MPRVYRKLPGPGRRRQYEPEQLAAAVRDVRTRSMTLRAAAKKHSVPYTTLQEGSRGKYSKPYGGQTALTAVDESTLATCLRLCADWGFPLRRQDLRILVKSFLDKRSRLVKVFKDNVPGRDWVHGFLRRHDSLSERLAQNVRRSRAAVSQEVILEYFRNLETSLTGVPPQNIVNYDETGFVADPGRRRAIFRRGARKTDKVIDHSKAHTSVMFAISAEGELLPPYVLYKAKYLYESWTEGGPPRAFYDSDESGWFSLKTFENWFVRVAVPYFRKLEGDKVLIGDNLSSHLSATVIEACQDLNIRFVLLPSNSTHLCQPLDVAWFRPLKSAWSDVLEARNSKTGGSLPKTEFPRLLNQALEKIEVRLRLNAISGFRATGIYPLDPSQVLKRLPSAHQGEFPEADWTAVLVAHHT